MGLNINALRSKLNQFTKQNDRSSSIWKPSEGKAVIRIVPWTGDRTNPFIELHFHYMGGKTYLSPITHGNRDPIAEFAEKIVEEGRRESREAERIAYGQSKQFRPKLRTYIPVIVRGEEDKGVRFMAFGQTVYTELLSIMNDPDYGDITDPQTGRDIVVDYIPQQKSDTNFAKTSVRVKPNQTPLAASQTDIDRFLTEQPDIFSLYKEPTYQELKLALAAYLNPDNDPLEVDAPDTPATAPAPTSSPTATRSAELKKVTSTAALIEDFDEVFK